MKVAIIGAGFFGLYIADYMSRKGFEVDIYEKEKEAMQRASYVNQARVHNGYHYPRSILTASRSHKSFPIFCEDFKSAIDSKFEKYYAIAKKMSKVNSKQFEKFCDRLDLRCDFAPKRIHDLFDKSLIEDVFCVEEYAFNYKMLRSEMFRRMNNKNINILFNLEVLKVKVIDNNKIKVITELGNNKEIEYQHVFNCTYASINEINEKSFIKKIDLIHELTELVLIDPPKELKSLGITVMCGPFFSTMPFPSENCHSLSHVRYTPNGEYHEISHLSKLNSRENLDNVNTTSFKYIINDVSRYLPSIVESKYLKSLWEIKTILPSSSNDDSRPILFKANFENNKGYHCIMGGKIDNIYDVIENIELEILR